MLLTLSSSPLTENMYPRLQGTAGYKGFTGAYMIWHTKRNAARRSSQISANKTFMYSFWVLKWCSHLGASQAPWSIKVPCYTTLPRFCMFQVFWILLPWKPRKGCIPNQNARSDECFKIIIEVIFLSLYLEGKFFHFSQAMLSHTCKMPKRGSNKENGGKRWKAEYPLVLYYALVSGTGPGWRWGAIFPQPTGKPRVAALPCSS